MKYYLIQIIKGWRWRIRLRLSQNVNYKTNEECKINDFQNKININILG